jgi:hypothetical protein
MGKLNIAKSALNKVKGEIKNNLLKDETNNQVSIKQQIENAKFAAKQISLDETNLTQKELEDLKNKFKEVKNEFKSTQTITTHYGFKIGDIVSFKHDNKQEIGIVYEIQKSKHISTTIEDVMSRDKVLLFSSIGFVRVSSNSIFEIIECI